MRHEGFLGAARGDLWFPATRGEETWVKTRLQSSHFAHEVEEKIYFPYIFYISKNKKKLMRRLF